MPLAAVLLPALCAAAAETASVTYLAQGVDVQDITASTRFYDVGKGAFYWNSHLTETEKLYNITKDFSFMGELKEYVRQTHFSPEAFYGLERDKNTCWYNAGSNAIQYWQDCYAPFYRRENQSGALPQGLTYNRDNLEVLAGTQSLRVNMAFYDTWDDLGGAATDAFDWYLSGNSEKPGSGGYFQEYFGYGSQAGSSCGIYSSPGVISMEKVTKGIFESFGLVRKDDGTLQPVEQGLIPTLSAGNNAAAHALTCYGFTLDADGVVNSLYIADSDDAQYRIEQVYLKVEGTAGNERLLMFEDEACSQYWNMDGPLKWGITGIYHINTPDELKTLYGKFHDPERPMEWTGETEYWSTDTTLGWDVEIDGETYTSGYENGRVTRFTDKAEEFKIYVQGKVEAARMEVTNDDHDYKFMLYEGDDEATLEIGKLNKSGGGALDFHDFAVTAERLLLNRGTISLNDGASLEIVDTVRVEGGSISSKDASEYCTDNREYTISNATVTVLDEGETTLRNTLDNVQLVNDGSGELTVDSDITGRFSMEALDGNITFLNRGAGITVQELSLAAEQTISVYNGGVVSEEEETDVIVTGRLTAGKAAKLVANLTLGEGATLDVSGADAMGLKLGSSLTLNPGMNLSQEDMELIAKMSRRDTYGLFTGVDDLTLAGTDIIDCKDPVSVDAVGWFRGFQPMQYYICYDGSNVGLRCVPIPEPATGALSLLALAALARRRRRG
ncbi:MAG: PEP-CTERM sorting domain-containing protein [Akkermansia sp.]|nr:PEP-CTERM sorting domain-containing protein [Akkermansia sp.]